MSDKITIFAPNFSRGGIENICFILAGKLSKSLKLEIITNDTQLFRAKLQNTNTQLRQFTAFMPTGRLFQKIKLPQKPANIIATRNYLNEVQPKVIITFKSPLTAVIARIMARHKPYLIVRESNSVQALRGNRLVRFIKRRVKQFVYKKADCVIALCHEMHDELVEKMQVQPSKIRVIYNPTIFGDIDALKAEPLDDPWLRRDAQHPTIIASGRFDEQKDFTTLLYAFANVVNKRQCRLIIIGDGHLRHKIVALINNLNIGEYVKLTGFTGNPFKYIAKSTIFVLSSRYEGLANSLIEALACGTPTIATACPTSPTEILLSGKAGLLVPVGDIAELTRAIELYLNDRDLRETHLKVAQASLDRFDASANSEKYLSLIREAVS